MVAQLALDQAYRAAEQFLYHYGVRRREHIDVERWVADMGIDLVEDQLDGASAQLVRRGDRTEIVLSTRVADPRQRRFDCMHEVGHVVLRHPSPSPTMVCSPRADRPSDTHARAAEVVASAFAGAVLLPAAQLRARCSTSPAMIDTPRQIADEYGVSILASAIRYCELTAHACAAVFARGGKVVWSATSDSFPFRIRKGHRVTPNTVASRFFDGRALDDTADSVEVAAWNDNAKPGELIESATYSQEHGTVLSFLWAPNPPL